MSHKRTEKETYKYEIDEIRPGTWKVPRDETWNLDYWHLVLKVNGKYQNSQEVLETVQGDLNDLFGDIEVRNIKDINYSIKRRATTPLPMCFTCIIRFSRGSWYADLHLLDEWTQPIKILL